MMSTRQWLTFDELPAEQQRKVIECVNNVNAVNRANTVDVYDVMHIVNKFAPPAPVDDLVQKMINEVRAKAEDIAIAARKHRNQRKRERRARRGK
jgi:hypothetical protein